MKIKADLHNHLYNPLEDPFKLSFDKLIEISRARLGEEGILGVIDYGDNKTFKTIMRLKDNEQWGEQGLVYFPEQKIWLLKGQELETIQGHLLVLGLPLNINLKNKRTLEESIKEAEDYSSIIIAPHSFFIDGIGIYLMRNIKLLEKFHAIEIHNGEAIWGNNNAQRFYNEIKKDYDLGAVSFSDGHSLFEIGLNYTWLEPLRFNKQITKDALKNSIKNHKDYFDDKQATPFKLATINHALRTVVLLALEKFEK